MEQGFTVLIPLVIFGILDLIIFCKSLGQGITSKTQRAFVLFAGCAVIIQFGSVICYANDYGILQGLPRAILYVIYIVSITAMTTSSYCWFGYLILSLPNGVSVNKVHGFLFFIPTLILFFATASSPWTHYVFFLDQTGAYQAGSYYTIQIFGPYCYVIFALSIGFYRILLGKTDEITKMVVNFLFFLLPSIVGVVLQSFVCRGGYSQIGISLGLILMYFQQYLEEVNELKRLKDLAELNEKLQVVNQEQEEQLKKIRLLYAKLEESTCEQEAQIEEITSLNQALEHHVDIIEAMSRIYFASYYINLEEDSFIELTSQSNIRSLVGMQGDAQKSLNEMCEKLILPEFAPMMREFADLSTIVERLKEGNVVTCEYIGVTSGWSQAFIIAGDCDDKGNPTHVFFAARTIHAEKEREEASNRALEEARKIAEEANEAKTRFLFSMSHDIRTPMNAIIGFRDLLEQHQDDPIKRADYLKKIQDASKLLLSIINNVLEMSRIESGSVKVETLVRSVYGFNDSLCNVFAEMMKQKKIQFKRSIEVKDNFVYCDPIKLREVFLNILSNAYKYTNEGGTVTMTLKELPFEKEGWGLFQTTIQDTGLGMDEDYLPHLFEEFSREEDSTTTKIEGTGLGMPIVKRLLEQMNGTIEVESKKGVGTKFVVTIPHKIATESSYTESVEVHDDLMKNHNYHILLAEDNNLNAEIAIELLKRIGFVVDWAENGAICIEKLKAARAGAYDLILMDVQMPVMGGYEAANAIRNLEDEKKASLPILAMTANAFEEDKIEARNNGMNGHIAKPINMHQMTEEIYRVLSEKDKENDRKGN